MLTQLHMVNFAYQMFPDLLEICISCRGGTVTADVATVGSSDNVCIKGISKVVIVWLKIVIKQTGQKLHKKVDMQTMI